MGRGLCREGLEGKINAFNRELIRGTCVSSRAFAAFYASGIWGETLKTTLTCGSHMSARGCGALSMLERLKGGESCQGESGCAHGLSWARWAVLRAVR